MKPPITDPHDYHPPRTRTTWKINPVALILFIFFITSPVWFWLGYETSGWWWPF